MLWLRKIPQWKIENVNPIPKVLHPEILKDLKKISGLLNFSKITDKILAQYIADDMHHTRDKSQYGSQKNIRGTCSPPATPHHL